MDLRDRKRDFSNAFEISHDPYRKALRGITGSTASRRPSFDTPIVIFGSNKENKEPFFDTNAELKQLNVSQAYMHQPLAFHFTGSRVELPYDGIDLTARERPMPLLERGHLHINPSPFEFSSSPCPIPPFDDVLASYTEPGPVIFEDPDPDTGHDQPDHNGLVTPTILSFQDLSLQETSQTWFPRMHQLSVGATRTSVFMVESKSLHCYFPNLQPEDIVIYYDKGKQVMKVNKSLLSNASSFYAALLNGPSLEDHTHCLRLRGDFPYAITAMVQFLENNIYAFDPYMRTQYSHITLLDLHIHAYIVGAKYHVRRLCDHAMDEYLNIGQMVLSMGITIDGQDVTDFTTEHSAQVNATSSVSAVVNHFLDSLVLIWRNTPQCGDALRDAVLELLKPYLPQLLGLKFFQTLMMEMAGFGDDVVQSLAEDGFDVKAFPVLPGFHEKGGIWFSGA